MKDKGDLLRQMKSHLDALGKEAQDDFDTVAHAFSIFLDSLGLLKDEYDQSKLHQLKQQDDPAFDRFASMLKMWLENQRDYLDSIADVLLVEPDLISQKISTGRQEIEAVLAQEGSLLKEGAELFAQEEGLRARKEKLAVLLEKKHDLDAISQELSGIDLDRLAQDVAVKEEEKRQLEEEYRPLLTKRERLEDDFRALKEARNNLGRDLAQLERAYGEEVARLMESIPQWVETIKLRIVAREEKDRGYLVDLERETENLQRVESQVQEHLKQLNTFTDQVLTYQEMLRTHFQANKMLGERFSGSLVDLKDRLAQMTTALEGEMKKFDDALRNIQQRLEAVAAEVKPIFLGG